MVIMIRSKDRHYAGYHTAHTLEHDMILPLPVQKSSVSAGLSTAKPTWEERKMSERGNDKLGCIAEKQTYRWCEGLGPFLQVAPTESLLSSGYSSKSDRCLGRWLPSKQWFDLVSTLQVLGQKQSFHLRACGRDI